MGRKLFFLNGRGPLGFENFGNQHGGAGKIGTATSGPNAGVGLWRSCSYVDSSMYPVSCIDDMWMAC